MRWFFLIPLILLVVGCKSDEWGASDSESDGIAPSALGSKEFDADEAVEQLISSEVLSVGYPNGEPYGWGKLLIEDAIQQRVEPYGLKVQAVRPEAAAVLISGASMPLYNDQYGYASSPNRGRVLRLDDGRPFIILNQNYPWKQRPEALQSFIRMGLFLPKRRAYELAGNFPPPPLDPVPAPDEVGSASRSDFASFQIDPIPMPELPEVHEEFEADLGWMSNPLFPAEMRLDEEDPEVTDEAEEQADESLNDPEDSPLTTAAILDEPEAL